LFLLTLLLQLQALSHAVLPVSHPSDLLYHWILGGVSLVLGKSAFAYQLLATALLYVQALLVNQIAIRHRLFIHQHYLPAFCFVLLSGMNPQFSVFSASLLCNFVLLVALHLLLACRNYQNANTQLFNIGFFVMIGALLQFPAMIIALFAFISLLIIRSFNLREWFVMLTGLVMPLYMLLVLLFCVDKFNWLYLWPQLGVSLPRHLKPAEYYFGLAGALIVWLGVSTYNMQSQLPKAPIYIRRSWIVVTILLFFSLIAACFSVPELPGVWVLCLPSLSLILAQAFSHERNKKMNQIAFYFVLALVIFGQIFLPL
jgi:hypothetical protein